MYGLEPIADGQFALVDGESCLKIFDPMSEYCTFTLHR